MKEIYNLSFFVSKKIVFDREKKTNYTVIESNVYK